MKRHQLCTRYCSSGSQGLPQPGLQGFFTDRTLARRWSTTFHCATSVSGAPALCNLSLKALPSVTPSNLRCRPQVPHFSMNPGLSREHTVPSPPPHLRTATPPIWKVLSAHLKAPHKLLPPSCSLWGLLPSAFLLHVQLHVPLYHFAGAAEQSATDWAA